MSTPVEGGRGVRLRVLGVPVHIDLSFVLIMGFIGYLSGATGPALILIWLLVAALAVLAHEMGHALVARTTGAAPAIALTGFGGVTTYVPPKPLSRARSLAIALAGPFAGLMLAAVIYVVRARWGADLPGGRYVGVALYFGWFTTFWWSMLNLLPVLPLDGGQALRELLPGAPEVRARRAAIVSIVLLIPLIALALWQNQMFVAVFLVLFGVTNVQAVMNRPDHPDHPDRSDRPLGVGQVSDGSSAAAGLSPEQAVVGLLWQGAPSQARATLESLPPGTVVDLAVHGAVLSATGDVAQGEALIRQELARRPADANVVALLVLAHILRHDWDAVVGDLLSDVAPLVPLAVVERALQEATATGRPDVAERLSALPRPEPR